VQAAEAAQAAIFEADNPDPLPPAAAVQTLD
jgi:hypothetical protein